MTDPTPKLLGSFYDEGVITFQVLAADPEPPEAGFYQLYAKAGGLFVQDDHGTVVGPLAAAGGPP